MTAGGRGGFGAWALLLPALIWTVAFFAMPLAVMAIYSLWQRVGVKLVRDPTTANYEKFFGKSFLFDSLVNSIEVTVIVTLISILLAYPLAYILAERVPRRPADRPRGKAPSRGSARRNAPSRAGSLARRQARPAPRPRRRAYGATARVTSSTPML